VVVMVGEVAAMVFLVGESVGVRREEISRFLPF
jgi:hypothetical protein